MVVLSMSARSIETISSVCDGDVGDEDDRYVAEVGAFGCVFEWASGARLGGGARALLGVSAPIDLGGKEAAFGTRCFRFGTGFGLGGERGMCAIASLGSQRAASDHSAKAPCSFRAAFVPCILELVELVVSACCGKLPFDTP